MNVLVTGGAGYIGSHTCVALLKADHEVIVLDNLSKSKAEVLDKIEKLSNKKVKFYKADVTDKVELERIFSENNVDGVIHFAGFKSVKESVEKPLMYYRNNLLSTMTLAEACINHDVKKIVFSSSATVYGEQQSPFLESMELKKTINPYGETKAIGERILCDVNRANPEIAVTLLRYFNPIGAHESGLIGEDPIGIPSNLLPYINRVASGKLEKLSVFGNSYPTKDGTGIRDYIHVMDLAEGHVVAIEKLVEGVNIYNMGTGKGTSVMEILRAFEYENGIKIPFEIVDPRPGDMVESYADVSKAEKELGWKATRGVSDMVRDAWNFERGLL